MEASAQQPLDVGQVGAAIAFHRAGASLCLYMFGGLQRQDPTVPKQEALLLSSVTHLMGNRHGQCLDVKKLVLAHTVHVHTCR